MGETRDHENGGRGAHYRLVGPLAPSTSYAYAFLGALLLWMAMPPLDWWPLAWIAPVPWVLLIRLEKLPGRRPYTVLALAGFAFWLGVLHWLRLPHPATSIGWVALSFYFAFYVPLFIGLSRVAVHRLHVPVALAAPLVWAGLELARAHLLTGMSMGNLGHTQYRWIALIQVSDLTGDYGVGFVVMCVAASLARMLPCNDRASEESRGILLRPLAPAMVLLAAVLGYGYFRTSGEYTSPGPKVALIQGSIDVEMLDAKDEETLQRLSDERTRRIWSQYVGLSQEAVRNAGRIDLVVWPESMFPWSLVTFDSDAAMPPQFKGTEAEFRESLSRMAEYGPAQMAALAKELDAPLLLGLDTFHCGSKGDRLYASAAFVDRDGALRGRYDKNHLVMFGEYVPLGERFPWIQRLTPLPRSATHGHKAAAFEIAGARIAPNICYESVLSHVIRRQVNALASDGQEPDVLINVTNDGWFWGSSELDLHLACGVFRAVECRKPFLIAANTGFSAWIDGDGRILHQGPRRATSSIVADVQLDHRTSWYLRHGDWFAGICLLGCVGFATIGLRGRWRANRASAKCPAMD